MIISKRIKKLSLIPLNLKKIDLLRLVIISGKPLSQLYWSLNLQKYLSDYAEENGFRVTRGVAEISTAFVAEFGSGKPVIGILESLMQILEYLKKKQPTKEPLVKGAAGHGCGHNLYGTGSLGAAIAIKEMIESGEISGTVRFLWDTC